MMTRMVRKINKTKGTSGARTGKEPLRRCVSCKEMKPKKDLVRVIKNDNINTGFSMDETGKAAGRGAYICKDDECLAKVVKIKGFDRSFKQKVPAEIYEQLERALAKNDE